MLPSDNLLKILKTNNSNQLNDKDNMDPLKFLTIFLGILTVILFSSIWLFGTDPGKPPHIETQERGRVLHFEGSYITVEIITVDGVEYLVTKCRDGVGVCKK